MTLTHQQREDLKAELDALADAEKPIIEAMEPLRKACAGIEEVRGMTLLRYGLEDEPEQCEGCETFILPGDKYHPTADAGPLCFDCSPTWADVKQQKEEVAGEAALDAEDRAEARQVLAHVNDHLAHGGALTDKCVYEYQP